MGELKKKETQEQPQQPEEKQTEQPKEEQPQATSENKGEDISFEEYQKLKEEREKLVNEKSSLEKRLSQKDSTYHKGLNDGLRKAAISAVQEDMPPATAGVPQQQPQAPQSNTVKMIERIARQAARETLTSQQEERKRRVLQKEGEKWSEVSNDFIDRKGIPDKLQDRMAKILTLYNRYNPAKEEVEYIDPFSGKNTDAEGLLSSVYNMFSSEAQKETAYRQGKNDAFKVKAEHQQAAVSGATPSPEGQADPNALTPQEEKAWAEANKISISVGGKGFTKNEFLKRYRK